MKALFPTLGIVVLCTTVTCTPSVGQSSPPPERPARTGAGSGGGLSALTRMNPIFTALDANGDGTIDAEEIEGAVTALKKLDTNGDGQITEDEVRFVLSRGVRGRPEMRDAAPPSRTSDEIVDRLMEFDRNGDGKLEKDEIPERMRAVFARGDANQDGFLTPAELKAIAEAPRANGTVGEESRRGAPVSPVR